MFVVETISEARSVLILFHRLRLPQELTGRHQDLRLEVKLQTRSWLSGWLIPLREYSIYQLVLSEVF